jgi:hypothetical protein
MSIDYAEQDGSPTEEWGENGFSAQRRLKVAWADRRALVDELIGTEYPLLDDTGAICRRISCVPFPGKNLGEGSVSAYEFALITAAWDTVAWRASGGGPDDPMISESIEPTAEYRTLNYEKYRWGSGSGDLLKAEDAPGLLLQGIDYVVTKYAQSAIPAAALTLINHVNDAALYPLTPGLRNWVFAAETLLFHPASARRTIQSGMAEWKWDVTYRFSYKPNRLKDGTAKGWNWQWRGDTDRFDQIYLAGGGVFNICPTGDFTVL